MKVIKRDGTTVDFDPQKIVIAISKANDTMRMPEHKISKEKIDEIAEYVRTLPNERILVEEIQDIVEQKLQEAGKFTLAKAYIIYRFRRALVRKANTTDESILSLIRNDNKDVMEENSNKNAIIASTQRDLIAGEVSKDIATRIMLPERIAEAHKKGILHFHDLDYFIQPIINCCLINIGDMLDNGTAMNGKMIESPKSFQVACNVMTQIIATVASGQYGGQSVDMKHLGKYLRRSKEKLYKKLSFAMGDNCPKDLLDKAVAAALKEELKSGVQTIQYQINTLMTTNGQAPFVTLFLHLEENDPYIEENAMIIEEILRQRLEGMKNEAGVLVTPAFPKLVYVLDEHNCLKGGKYDYLTHLAAKCSAKRMYPDYISAKKMRENYEGNVFSPMGCVEGNEVISYRFNGREYVESFKRAWERLSSAFETKEQNPGDNRYLYIDVEKTEIFDTKKNNYVPMRRIIRNTSSDWKQVTLQNGRTLTCTANHPFEAENRGQVYAKDLTNKDKILINTNTCANEGTEPYNPEKAWMLGVILCDGSYVDTISVSIAKTGEEDIEEKYRNAVSKIFGLKTQVTEQKRGEKGNYKDIIALSNGKDTQSQISASLMGMFGGKSKRCRHIPTEVFNWDKTARIAFLAGMIDADGYINNNSNLPVVQIGSTNKELALQQMLLAQTLGMDAHVYINHYKANNKDNIRYRVEFYPTQELIDAMACEKKKTKFTNVTHKNHSVREENIVNVTSVESINMTNYSYDVTTDSEHFEVSGIYSHNCRSFLSAYKDENGKYKFEGRFNQGVVSLNLPQVGIVSGQDEDKFWKELDKRLQLCYDALMCRHNALLGTKSDVSPIHWQYGCIARLKKGEAIDPLLNSYYSTLSLGYIGLYEVTKLVKGVSHTEPEGEKFALAVMKHLRETVDKWKKESGLGFALYGTPAESLCYRFARVDKEQFGTIPDVTDKGYYTNSYHIDVREHIDAFSKLKFESQFQKISSGGAISYVEVPNMQNNIDALETLIRFIYDNIQYAEFNTKSDYCMNCGYDGEIIINDDNEWECPQCHNKDHSKMSVVRRTCGYLGSNYWNNGKTKEIKARVLHL